MVTTKLLKTNMNETIYCTRKQNMAFLEFGNITKQIKTEKSKITSLRGNYSGSLSN